MKWVIPVADLTPEDRGHVGGKAHVLSLLDKGGYAIPKTLCIPTRAYKDYLDKTGLRERIQSELRRKDFSDMRWEEMWDCALRIRHMFSRKPLPGEMALEIEDAVAATFGDQPVAIRSSAVDEDSAAHSFAGIHDSYINIKGSTEILKHLRRVWASLWSDTALLYRREIGLDVHTSKMAVVIQEVINGESSGIAFTKSPTKGGQGIVEAVHGLNQALVDGMVEPDRWTFDRNTGKLLNHSPAKRKQWMRLADSGVLLENLPPPISENPPLDMDAAESIFSKALSIETFFGIPQDIEWTMVHQRLVFLQARPITGSRKNGVEDSRSWYLSLRRTYEDLKALRTRIESVLVPEMIKIADQLAAMDIGNFGDMALAEEIRRRKAIYGQWKETYWSDFIPFAHGMRLFGEIYNETIQPEDPYEFVGILAAGELLSLDRNRQLEGLAQMVRDDKGLADALREEDEALFPQEFRKALDAFNNRFGDVSCGMSDMTGCQPDPGMIYRLLLGMAAQKDPSRRSHEPASTPEDLAAEFIRRFPKSQTMDAVDLLDLGRASYRMRDDDNIYLGRIETQLYAAVKDGSRRIADAERRDQQPEKALTEAVRDMVPQPLKPQFTEVNDRRIRSRQLRGQPAGPGFSSGTARVVYTVSDLADFKQGEILVCDAIEPNMTFVVPLAAAIVERRGGMLVHGAIIAREYGLPCVTGIADAAQIIRTGDRMTVDGYLGIVTILSME